MPRVQTTVVEVDPQEPDPRVVESAAQVLRDGGLAVVPTDTVYGLVCDPGRPAAVDRIYRVKRRKRELPLSLLLNNMGEVAAYVEDPPEVAVRAMQQFWPGPLTIILGRCKETAGAVRARRRSIGLRLPAHMVPRLVAGEAGFALASTSANPSGQPSPVTGTEAARALSGLVEIVLDAGRAPLGQESTIVDFTLSPPRLLREGALAVERILEVVGSLDGP